LAVEVSTQHYLTDEQVDFLLDPVRFGSYIEKNKQLIFWLEYKDFEFSLPALVSYIEETRNSKMFSASTVNVRKSQVKKIVTEISKQNPEHWTTLEQFKIDQLFRSIKAQKKQTNEVSYDRILSRQELEEFMDHLSRMNKKIYMFARFLTNTGCRVSEMINISIQDCTLTTQNEYEIKVMGKGQKERTLYIPKDLYEQIYSTFHENGMFKFGPLFCTQGGNKYGRQYVSRELSKYGKLILGRPVTAHRLRHSFATLMIESGEPVKAVSEYLGHNNTAITQDMYVHVKLNKKRLPNF
jgi:integrase